ncbi:hypothetical protein AGMMS49928_00180 [Spirochaetia bacterium]|nr:hypothetical protein AGMMS49928_00180 [Spirochaetia bacterium]
MPTFRTASHDGVPYNPFLDIGFDETAFFDILKKKNLVFLYKLHFCDEASDVRLHNERFMQVRDIDFDDLYVLLNNVDILITDYSSVYFDFIVTRKPVILAPFDYEFYIKKARAHYFDYFKNMEGIKAKTWPELCDILENETYYPVSDNTIIKYCEYNDGNSSAKCFHEIRDRQTC